jgi:hypothetical protein
VGQTLWVDNVVVLPAGIECARPVAGSQGQAQG